MFDGLPKSWLAPCARSFPLDEETTHSPPHLLLDFVLSVTIIIGNLC